MEKDVFRNIPDIDKLSKGLAALDVEESHGASWTPEQLPPPMPWRPFPDYGRDKENESEFPWPWTPFDPTVAGGVRRCLTNKDVEACQLAQWPPSDCVLCSLGMGPAGDAKWWKDIAGLKPPINWTVSGPHDLVGTGLISLSRQAHRDKATQELDGAIHGVTNVWLDETLETIREAMHGPDFWCYRGNDAFIRSFGGPYVLGQAEGKLKLVQGTPHTYITDKIARAHSLVYAATHLKLPAGPGFNTIVFGLNIRRGGFHYHQDSIGEIRAKNAPLVPRQPVVTSVFYELPDLDDKKELVNWRPMLNWSPSAQQQKKLGVEVNEDDDGRGTAANSFYLAARCVRTTHGMIHVQRAGLQARTKHGIFHCPNTEERKGYRVAITARIAWPNAEEHLAPYIASDSYARVFGPDGEFQLPRSTV